MRFNRLHPAGPAATAAELLDEDPATPRVRVNMVATLDGRAALGGSTRSLGGEADLAMLVALRAWAQALIVGPGTLRAEGYGRIREDLPVVLCSRSGDLPWEAELFGAEGQPVIVFTDAELRPPPVAATVEVLAGAAPDRMLRELRARGYGRILCEGGPALNRALLGEGLVDELFLTVDPLLTGGDELRIVEGTGFDPPLRARLLWVLEAGGELFLRYAL